MRMSLAPALVLVTAALAAANDPPAVDHQPALCTVPDKPVSLCAAVSDDGNVAVARIYFRRAGEDFYSFVAMSFTGVSYCGTLPPPRERAKTIEYYVQATDDTYQPQRTSTFRLPVQPEGVCEFPPIEKDEAKAAAIKVYAPNRKQGKKLDDGFDATGVTFVPLPYRRRRRRPRRLRRPRARRCGPRGHGLGGLGPPGPGGYRMFKYVCFKQGRNYEYH